MVKVTSQKWIKYRFTAVLIVGFGAFFIVALTFNDIGNGRTSPNLAAGFGCSLSAVLILGIRLLSSYKLFSNRSFLQPLLITLELVGLMLTILGAIFGTFGYLEFNN